MSDLARLEEFRTRVKEAEAKVAAANARHDAAAEDLEECVKKLLVAGLNPEDKAGLDKWMDDKDAELSALLDEINAQLDVARKMIEGEDD